MRVETRSESFSVTPSIRAAVLRSLDASLRRVTPRVERVRVSLVDTNGARGGVDKRCAMRAEVQGAGLVLAEAIEADAYEAVARAAMRLRHAVRRSQGRRRQRERRRRLAGRRALATA